MTENPAVSAEGDLAALLRALQDEGLDPARTCMWAWDPAPTLDSNQRLPAKGKGACPFLADNAPPLLEGHAFWRTDAGAIRHLLVLPSSSGALRWAWHEWSSMNVPEPVSVLLSGVGKSHIA